MNETDEIGIRNVDLTGAYPILLNEKNLGFKKIKVTVNGVCSLKCYKMLNRANC